MTTAATTVVRRLGQTVRAAARLAPVAAAAAQPMPGRVMARVPARAVSTAPGLGALAGPVRALSTSAAAEPVMASDDDFQAKVLDSKELVLVDFYADWCGPCRMLDPRLRKVAQELKVKLVKVNSDDNFDVPQRYAIKSLPTVIAFKKGKPVDTIVGLRDETDLAVFIKAALQKE